MSGHPRQAEYDRYCAACAADGAGPAERWYWLRYIAPKEPPAPDSRVSVLVPLAAGGHVVHVFIIGGHGVAWAKAHADEIARVMLPGAPYNALMVEPQ